MGSAPFEILTEPKAAFVSKLLIGGFFNIRCLKDI